MSEPPEEPKPGKKNIFLFVAILVFLMVLLPVLIILYFGHKLSQIH